MADIDPPGTCHLVGCPDKGQHPPHEINNWLTYLSRLGRELDEKAQRTADWLASMSQPIVDKTFPKIGAGEWSDYKPTDCCLGTPIATGCGLGDPTIHVNCSINPEAWGRTVSNIDTNGWAALVDDHKATCSNRRVTPVG